MFQNEVCFGGRARRVVRENTAELAGGFLHCGLEADEGSVDLPYTGQRQHDLSPVLRILL